MACGIGDRLLVWSYGSTDAYTLEFCDWYSPESFGHMHFEVGRFIRDQLDEFYAEFSEWFNLAEYPDVEEQLLPSERPVFLKAADAPADADFSDIGNHDCFSGLRAVIRHRLDQRSPESLSDAAELFNWTIDFGLSSCDTGASAFVRMGTVDDVAEALLERIADRLPNPHVSDLAAQATRISNMERSFLPFAPVIEILREHVKAGSWSQDEVALRILYVILEIYRAELLNEVV